MWYIGIDAGSTICKLVVINSDKSLKYSEKSKIGGDPEGVINILIKNALNHLNLKKKQVKIAISGHNSSSVINSSISSRFSEIKSIAEGVYHLLPNIDTIIDSGSFTNTIIKIGKNGKVIDYIVNDVCSSGSGIFLELVCKSLDISLDDMSELAIDSKEQIPITSQCSIFAESEVIYLMNEGKSVSDISAGCCKSIVGRLIPNILKLNPKPEILMTGGVAKNKAIVKMLEEEIKISFNKVDIDPQYISAYGTALLASNTKTGEK